MKKIRRFTIALAVISLVLTSCEKSNFFVIRGEGPVVNQNFDIVNFDEVELSGEIDVEISQGDAYEVVVEGQQNIIDRLRFENNNGELEIRLLRGVYRDYTLKVYLTAPDMNKVCLSGSGDIIFNGFSNLDDLELKVSGSGNIFSNDYIEANSVSFKISGTGNIDFLCLTESTTTTISGSGDITLSGETDVQVIDISGSGDFNCFGLNSQVTNIDVSGSGTCKVLAEKALNIDVSGSGDIYYRGFPNIDIDISGIGNVYNNN